MAAKKPRKSANRPKRARKRLTDADKLRRALADHPLAQIARALMPRTAAIVDSVVETAVPVAAEAIALKVSAELEPLDAKIESTILRVLTRRPADGDS